MMLKERMDALMKQFVAEGTPGCSCSVAKCGKTVYEGSFGVRNLETGEPMTLDTLFRMYSMTKVITCTAALMLYERGRFLLDDPVSKYLPEFANLTLIQDNGFAPPTTKPAMKTMLIRHLFSMTSGIPYPYPATESGRWQIASSTELAKLVTAGEKISTREMARRVARLPLAFEPGTQWLYGMSHDVLGALVEELSGMPFEAFLKKEIFERLQMQETSFRFAGLDSTKICPMYHKAARDQWEEGSGNDFWYETDGFPAMGGAGLISSLRDYQRFSAMLANGGKLAGARIIGRHTIDLMRQNQLFGSVAENFWDTSKGVGYGLGVKTLLCNAKSGISASLGSFGWGGMAGTLTLIDPAENLSFVFMQQTVPNEGGNQEPRILATIYGALED